MYGTHSVSVEISVAHKGWLSNPRVLENKVNIWTKLIYIIICYNDMSGQVSILAL